MMASVDSNSNKPTLIQHRDQVLNNFNIQLLRNDDDKFNDFKISLQGGEVFVNSTLMAKTCGFFSFDERFVEGQTKEIPMKEYGTKEAMERFVLYVYTGEMDLDAIEFTDLLEIMNISRMMLMKTNKLFESIEDYCKDEIMRVDLSFYELMEGLLLVSKYSLDSLKKLIVIANYYPIHYLFDGYLDDEDDNEEYLNDLVQQFPVEMMKEILLYHYKEGDWRSWGLPNTAGRFKYFMAWYSKNADCGSEDKKTILASFKLEDFTGEELLTVVKKSGLFPEEDIDQKCVEKFKKYQRCRKCNK